MDVQVWILSLIATLLAEFLHKGSAIHCFECYSVSGNQRDCEDQFGPYNQTGYLLKPNCKVGILKFTAYYCVKIKGVKDTGELIFIRTCSMDNWGTQCGDIRIEQQHGTDYITGCLASCDFDGCNTAGPSSWSRTGLLGQVTTLSLTLIVWTGHLALKSFTSDQNNLLVIC